MQPAHRLGVLSLVLCCVTIGYSQPLLAQGQVTVERIAPDLVFNRIMASAVGPDGRICVADDIEVKVTCLASDGTLLWSYGRKGGGPGEFRGMYRLALAPDMTVFVLDFSTRALHRLSSAGAHLGMSSFPPGFSQMNSLVAISPDTIAVAGTLFRPASARDAAVHLFAVADSIVYLRSFGELPAAVDPEKLSMSGAGFLTLTAHGTLLHLQRYPYTVTEYTRAGTALRKVVNPLPTLSPDDQMSIERTPSRTAYRAVPPRHGTNMVMMAHDAGNGTWWVGRRVVGGKQFFDIVDPNTGRWAAPVSFPPWGSLIAIFGEDRQRGMFLASTECDDEPCLIRFPSRPFVGQ
jgi:hypothetical protein